jgi:hypothetical protein
MNTLIKQLDQITGKNNIVSGLPQRKKQKLLARYINPTKYDFVGFVDRTNEVVLRPRYYNVRNKLGQFAAIEE